MQGTFWIKKNQYSMKMKTFMVIFVVIFFGKFSYQVTFPVVSRQQPFSVLSGSNNRFVVFLFFILFFHLVRRKTMINFILSFILH